LGLGIIWSKLGYVLRSSYLIISYGPWRMRWAALYLGTAENVRACLMAAKWDHLLLDRTQQTKLIYLIFLKNKVIYLNNLLSPDPKVRHAIRALFHEELRPRLRPAA
jgi:hypothetical protein